MKKKKLEELVEKEKEIKKLKHEISFYKRKYRSSEKERLTENKFVENCMDVLSTLKPLKPLKYKSSKDAATEQDAVLLFSDCQIGEKVEYRETQITNYNMKIFEKRLARLYDGIVEITNRHRKDTPIDNLNLFMLGDIVEGGGKIFRGQPARLEDNIMGQFFEGVQHVGRFIQGISRHYDKVNITAISGNHGRVDPKKDENKFYVNWDFMMYKFLEQITKNIKNINWNIPWSWWDIVDVKGWKFYLDHGDTLARKYMSIPWYGLERGDHRTMKMMQGIGKKYDYVCIGHYHVPFQWDASWGERICNGSFSSGNYYAAKHLQATARPTQIFAFVHPKIGITARYLVRLDLKK